MNLQSLAQLWEAGLPIWIVTIGGLAAILLDLLEFQGKAKLLFALGIGVLIAAGVVTFNRWVEPGATVSGITLDSFSLYVMLIVFGVGILSLLQLDAMVSLYEIQNHKTLPGAYVSLVLFAVVGLIFLFATSNLILMFIGLETMSLAVYVLVGSLARYHVRGGEAAMKYFVLGSVASAILLFGIALNYALTQTFDLNQIQGIDSRMQPLAPLAMLFILAGAFFKVSLAPFHIWTPDVYEGAPTPITGFMSAFVKVGAFAFLIRVLAGLHLLPYQKVLLSIKVAVILTLIVGNLGALVQTNLKRMLAYSSIAHAGFVMLGLYVGYGPEGFNSVAVTQVLFYLLSYSVMTLGAFGTLTLLIRDGGEATQLSDLSGLGFSRPYVSLAFSLFLISLLGIPPTVGFMAKYGILTLAIQNGYWHLAILAMVLSAASAYYYLKPLVYLYFGKEPAKEFPEMPATLLFSVCFCAVAVIYLGLCPTSYLKMAELAARVF